MEQTSHYDVEYYGKIYDIEATTPEEAEEWANKKWCEDCEEEGIRDGEVMESDAEILKVDTDTGDILERFDCDLYAEGSRSDYDEHNLNYRGGFL